MAGPRGIYADGAKFYFAEDAAQDSATFLGNDAAIALALLGGGNWLVSGGALALTSGMSGTIAQTTVFANGVLLTVPAGTFTLSNGNTQPRYDVLYVVLGATGGTNPTSGNTTTADSGTFGVQPGTPGDSPVKQTLTNANYCQIGSVYVPANATVLNAGNLNSQDTSPNANGPLPAFTGVVSHIAASLATATVHGFQATTPGGYGGPGANKLAQMDANGRVGDSHRVDTYRQVWGISSTLYTVAPGQTVNWTCYLDDSGFTPTRVAPSWGGTEAGAVFSVGTYASGQVTGTVLNVSGVSITGAVIVVTYGP